MSPNPPCPMILPSLHFFFSVSVKINPSGSGFGSTNFFGGAIETEVKKAEKTLKQNK